MKKVLLTLLMMVAVTFFVFATAEDTVDGTLSTGTSDSATFTYKLTISNTTESGVGDGTVSIYKIGFSSNSIANLTDTPTAVTASDKNLVTSTDDFTASLAKDVYIYWQIASPYNCDISLTAASMTGTDSSNVLPVTVSTANADGVAGVPYEEVNTATEGATLTKTIYSFVSTNTTSGQSAGSQKLSLTTDTIEGLAVDTYTGTLTLTITGKN